MNLLGALGADGLDDIDVDTLKSVLSYHVIPGVAAESFDLFDGQVLTTLGYVSGTGELIVDLTEDGVTIDGVGSNATVVIPNVAAGSAIVHVVDTVLLPFEAPEPAPSLPTGLANPKDIYEVVGATDMPAGDEVVAMCSYSDWSAGLFYFEYGTPAVDVKLYQVDGMLYSTMSGFLGPLYENNTITRVGEPKVIGHAHIGVCADVVPRKSFAESTGAHWNFDTFVPYGEESNEIWYVGDAGELGSVDIMTPMKAWTLPGTPGPVPGRIFFDYNATDPTPRGGLGEQGNVPGAIVLHYIQADGSAGPQWACCPLSYDASFCDSIGGCSVYDASIEDTVTPPVYGAPEESVSDAPSGPSSVVEAAQGADDLSILVEAVVAAGLEGSALADPDAEITVLAPVNSAFFSLLGELGASGLEDIDIDTLTSVLTYHVIPGKAYSYDLFDGQNITTLNGAPLFVDLTEDSVIFDGIGSDATVIMPDLEAGSALVHLIDTVLLPIDLNE